MNFKAIIAIFRSRSVLVFGAMTLTSVLSPAPVPAGVIEELDKLARPDRLPEFHSGSRVAQFSSYDRTGGNDDGFSGQYSFLRKEEDHLVLAELTGPGVIHRIWTPTPTEDIIEFLFDGEDKPRIRLPFRDLFSGSAHPFVRPLVGHEIGGYFCYLPIPYEKSCRVIFRGESLQFIQIQYRTLPEGETTRSFPTEWDEPRNSALKRAGEVWERYGTDVSDRVAPPGAQLETSRFSARLAPGESRTLFETAAGGRIVGLRVSPASALSGPARDVVLKAWWDGESAPAIHAPLADFFGYAFGKPSMSSLFLGTADGVNYCYLPMPYSNSARLELSYEKRDGRQPTLILDFEVLHAPGNPRTAGEGRLYSVWRRERPAIGQPYLLLEASGRGHHVGTILQSQGLNSGMTLFFEGDDVAAVDGEVRLHGTGSEDYFNGGWYALPDRWDEGRSLPMHGCLTYSLPLARTGGYRFLTGDKIPFENSFRLTIEHGGEKNAEGGTNLIPVDYASLAFWYGENGPATNEIPAAAERIVHQPQTMEHWLQLLPVLAISKGSGIDYGGWRDPATRVHYETLTFKPAGVKSLLKVGVEVSAAGEYEVLLHFIKGPSCGSFQVYQRQAAVGGVIDAFAANESAVGPVSAGVTRFRAGSNSLTFQIAGKNKDAPAANFVLHRITLQRVNAPAGAPPPAAPPPEINPAPPQAAVPPPDEPQADEPKPDEPKPAETESAPEAAPAPESPPEAAAPPPPAAEPGTSL